MTSVPLDRTSVSDWIVLLLHWIVPLFHSHYPFGQTLANIRCSSGYVSSIKTGTRRITRLDELTYFVRRSSRTTEDSSSRRIMRLAPVLILETYNSTNNECLPKFVQTNNSSSNIKTAIHLKTALYSIVGPFFLVSM